MATVKQLRKYLESKEALTNYSYKGWSVSINKNEDNEFTLYHINNDKGKRVDVRFPDRFRSEGEAKKEFEKYVDNKLKYAKYEALKAGDTVHTPGGTGKVKSVSGSKVIVVMIDGPKIPQEYDVKDVQSESLKEELQKKTVGPFTVIIKDDTVYANFIYQGVSVSGYKRMSNINNVQGFFDKLKTKQDVTGFISNWEVN